jgi:peptide/nickel transport system substrate-binding protein
MHIGVMTSSSSDSTRIVARDRSLMVVRPTPRLILLHFFSLLSAASSTPVFPMGLRFGVFGAALAVLLGVTGPAFAEGAHAIAMHGAPAMPRDFIHMPYANPDAPKGGRLVQGVVGTFDSLNPLIIKGLALPAIRGYVIESLMARGYDEPFTLYGLIAKTIETDADRTAVIFTIDEAARFSDGRLITAADVLFSWQLLRDKGRPNHRLYYAKVTKAEALGEHQVRFELSGSNDRELPLILGLMPILPRHAVNPDTFEETSFVPPVGSGPYVVGRVDAGKSVTLVRDPNYWGRDLPINRGFWNFDEVRFDFYRDANSHFEAFKKGDYDIRTEQDPARWQREYDFPAVRDGRIVKESFPTGVPKANVFYVFNTRRPMFADIRVRDALTMLFDFEWIDRNLFFGLYRRTASYFDDSELAAYKRPADAQEHALLAPFPDAVRPEVMDGTWTPPTTDGSGRDRAVLHRALALFAAAGYELRGTALVEKATGKPFSFEIMVANRDDERLAIAYTSSLKRAGIVAGVRLVDAVQYEGRRLSFDFDMIQNRWDQSLSPGNEQMFYWGSAAADDPGTRNYMGVKSPAADAMIAALLNARGRTDFTSAVRALDRVLISGSYTIPLFYLPEQWVARWAAIGRPAKTPLSGYLPETGWRQPK